MYDTICYHFYCPHMSKDVYTTVAKCLSSARNLRTNKKQSKLCLFPLTGLLDLVAINILRPIPKTNSVNRYTGVITDRHSRLSKVIPAVETTATRIAPMFMEH